jgi:hypothetical protein
MDAKKSAYMKEYYEKHKEEIRKKNHANYLKNKEAHQQYSKRWRKEHPEARRAGEARYRAKHHEQEVKRHANYRRRRHDEIRLKNRKYYTLAKVEVLRHYSNNPYPKCVRCGEVDIRCLTIDHINGGGNRERKETSGRKVYTWLRNIGFPKGYQTLCMNCQLKKRWENDENRSPRLR